MKADDKHDRLPTKMTIAVNAKVQNQFLEIYSGTGLTVFHRLIAGEKVIDASEEFLEI